MSDDDDAHICFSFDDNPNDDAVCCNGDIINEFIDLLFNYVINECSN